MKPSIRDYLVITAALLTVLLCGYGIGFLVGERSTRERLAANHGTVNPSPDWSAATIDRLTRQLSLTPAQQQAVAKEVRQTAGATAETRRQAIRQYRMALVDLHNRLLPHLDAGQRRQVEESRDQLQQALDQER